MSKRSRAVMKFFVVPLANPKPPGPAICIQLPRA
jgi:hypothetical protein